MKKKTLPLLLLALLCILLTGSFAQAKGQRPLLLVQDEGPDASGCHFYTLQAQRNMGLLFHAVAPSKKGDLEPAGLHKEVPLKKGQTIRLGARTATSLPPVMVCVDGSTGPSWTPKHDSQGQLVLAPGFVQATEGLPAAAYEVNLCPKN